jgi:hypothetical protein
MINVEAIDDQLAMIKQQFALDVEMLMLKLLMINLP